MDKDPRSQQSSETPPEAGDGLEVWLRPYFSDSALWPVLLVFVATLSVLGAAVLVAALQSRNPFAAAALLLLAFGSAEGLRANLRQRRLDATGVLIGLLWLLSAGVALAAACLGLV